MPAFCCVANCANRSNRDPVSFFRFPMIDNRTESLKNLSNKRITAWLSAIRRSDLTNDKLRNSRICSKHFISGRSSDLTDELNPDWIPTLNLGHEYEVSTVSAESRYKRKRKRDEIKDKIKAESVLKSTILKPDEYLNSTHRNIATQTEITGKDITNYELEIESGKNELLKLNKQLNRQNYNLEHFKDDRKCNYFTGISQFFVLNSIFNFVNELIPIPVCQKNSFEKFHVFVLTLMKLRLDLPFTLLGFMFNISTSTASHYFYKCIAILSDKLSGFVIWPEREAIISSTPLFFKQRISCNITVIIDCFEIFIESPGTYSAKAGVFSNYKHHNTLKYLIGIAPAGNITFISNGFGGRCSDKFVTENCGFLELLNPGDIVLSDKGFHISNAIEERGAVLKRPAFCRKVQLDPFDIEDTRNVAALRIHIERVIGTLRQKYLILAQRQPITTVKKEINGEYFYDKIVHTCCALVNLNPTIIVEP